MTTSEAEPGLITGNGSATEPRGLVLPQELVEDACGFDLVGFLVQEALRPPGTRPRRSAPPTAVIPEGTGMIDAALRIELVEGVLEDLEGADTEGLGAPWTEEAASTVDWILDQLNSAGLLVKRSPS